MPDQLTQEKIISILPMERPYLHGSRYGKTVFYSVQYKDGCL